MGLEFMSFGGVRDLDFVCVSLLLFDEVSEVVMVMVDGEVNIFLVGV